MKQHSHTQSKRHKLRGADGSSIANPSDLQIRSYKNYQLAKNTQSPWMFHPGSSRWQILLIEMH
jgi:hypothetical protein